MITIFSTILQLLPSLLRSKIGLSVVLTAAAFSLGGYAGWSYRDYSAEKAKNDSIERAIEEANKQWEIDREILESSVKIQREIKTVFKYIEREVDDVEVNDCTRLGDSWLRVYNSAARAAKEGDANK